MHVVHSNGEEDGDDHTSKKPRLRLAHACDRCRRRKIRCDTQQPCGPCKQTGTVCTFETPSRRLMKKRERDDMDTPNSSVGNGTPAANPNRPKAGRKPPAVSSSNTGGGIKAVDNQKVYTSTLEARLNNLEALLRSIPPGVHNALINQLDGQLSAGTQPGQSNSASVDVQGVSGAIDGLSATDFAHLLRQHGTTLLGNPGLQIGASSAQGSGPINPEQVNQLGRNASGISLNLSNGYLYVDEIGQTKWQGATSGFPLLDLLTANSLQQQSEPLGQRAGNADVLPTHTNDLRDMDANKVSGSPPPRSMSDDSVVETRGRTLSAGGNGKAASDLTRGLTEPAGNQREEKFFPDRAPRPSQMLNPEATWRVITNVIPSDLMDTLVRCYLSTSHLLWPFLHVPSFLKDYADPQKWAEPGFACFVVAVCTLSSRHVDDPRVRAKADDPSTAGKQYFELFKRLRDLPSADRPTLYSIQAAFLAAIFAFGLGTLSKAFSLLAESVTLCLDGGLHRSVEGYNHFNAIEQEMRKRTFWSIYSWDKQSAALFGRPPIIHLRDCDVPEPLQIDDEYLTKEKILDQPPNHQTRLSAFVAVIRLHVVLEGVIDSCVSPSTFAGSSFLSKAAATISRRCQAGSLAEEEKLLEEWVSILPKHWHYDVECVESKDPIRITQAERLHCLEHLVRMIVYRHRFSGFVQAPAETDDERARHLLYCRKAMDSALTICANHVHISQRGMMTYYGVHVIHQLAQAGRTLVAVVLNCKTPEFSGLIAPATEGLRSCVGLLRRFSGRYLCGLRSADIIEEFCRICHIPVETPRTVTSDTRPSPAWLRPVQRRHSPSPAPTRRRRLASSQTRTRPSMPDRQSSSSTPGAPRRHKPDLNSYFTDGLDNPASANALLSTQDFFDLSAAASPGLGLGETPTQSHNGLDGRAEYGIFDTLGPASAPFDQFESLEPDSVMADAGNDLGQNAWDVPFAPGNDVLGNM
ncbi:fungal-specific transcription factor domain-containing protein [Filobasidium floriforme]|uniref:fungal-specific transcription factor domain-containing protein n=1 Tax=Filobasidium floriforme TaxID=5210 RepID=UPI001E8CBCD8|nr:fungal-specific transcription factor domain-containing protein [Filobasidium floriforme]KAH8086933.1 fungal-specific transcription factor domain-containing protein [Filobasidium floriforme]